MNRTVAYQETSNNYTDTRQQIKGAQIATIKNFGVAPPAGGGDYIGQLGISADVNGEAMLYTYGVGGLWQLVGKSGDASNLPDTVVHENRANNFTVVNQRIEDCPITFIDSGTRLPANVAIKGPGHFYVYDSTPPQLFCSFDGIEWSQLRTGSDVNTNVEVDKANNFTNPDQEIMSRPIMNLTKSSVDPTVAGVVPEREGQIYVQIAEGTADGKARMWVSNKEGATWKWEALSNHYELPRTVAQTSKDNDFQTTGQFISGKQISSFIDGGDKTPEQSKVRGDYDGQFYFAVHTDITGVKDVAIWVWSVDTWLPIQQDFDLNTIARLDRPNIFSSPNQTLGESGPMARHLIGAREKRGGHSPLTDNSWRVQNIGEITVFENNTVTPREYSVWMGVSKNPSTTSNANEWALVWSSKAAGLDNAAKVDQSNEFVPFQYITNGQRKSLINVGHEGGSVDPKGRIIPMAPGDTFTQSFSDPGMGETRNIWMAAVEGDTDSWKRLLTEGDGDVAMVDRPNNFKTMENFIGRNTDTKRKRIMGARINNEWGPAYNGIAPTMFGEIVVCEEAEDPDNPGTSEPMVRAYLAVGTERKSWLMIGERRKKDLSMIDDNTNN